MYKIQLKLMSGNFVTIYFNTNLAVSVGKNFNTQEPEVRVMDGNHNNGGWVVDESYESIIDRIDAAIKSA